jgi:hypothetical protein
MAHITLLLPPIACSPLLGRFVDVTLPINVCPDPLRATSGVAQVGHRYAQASPHVLALYGHLASESLSIRSGV